jgi:hypothetical protein
LALSTPYSRARAETGSPLTTRARISSLLAKLFGRLRARAALDLLATPDGFDPDLCCLLLSLAWLA